MKAVETKENPDHESLAEDLMEQYHHQGVPVIDLIKDLAKSVESHIIAMAVVLLEQQARVYVERHPVLHNGKLRRDLLSSDIVYFDTFPSIRRRTLLYKTAVEYGDFTINHVLGCMHGCQYPCYAMQMSKRYGRVKNEEDWMHPRIVGNALDLLEKEIPRNNHQVRFVHLSFMTDPFMHDPVNCRVIPWIQELTLKIIDRLNQEDIKVTVLTKGLLPEVLKESYFNTDNEYGITLVSMDREFQDKYEPFSVDATKRLAALKELHDAGLKTWVSIEPYPTPNIVKQDFDGLLEKISFADKIIFGKWNYNPIVNGYSGQTEFYTTCADRVIEFCNERDILYHIKERTPRSSIETQDLFAEE